jgi:hypothetical protein
MIRIIAALIPRTCGDSARTISIADNAPMTAAETPPNSHGEGKAFFGFSREPVNVKLSLKIPYSSLYNKPASQSDGQLWTFGARLLSRSWP